MAHKKGKGFTGFKHNTNQKRANRHRGPAISKALTGKPKSIQHRKNLKKGIKQGMKRMTKITSKKWRKNIGKTISKNWKDPRFKKKMSKALKNIYHRHHLDLNRDNNKKTNILRLKNGKHQKLHRLAYHYLLEKYGIKEIRKYIYWFKKNIGEF